MKKIATLVFALFIILSIAPGFSYAQGTNLIERMQISLKSSESPKRLEVSFDLTEPIDLSRGNSDIIFEYFTIDGNGNVDINYKKQKSWSGYLNSYDNYPSGERKYSSGAGNDSYSDSVPATRIYTSARTNASIDVTSVVAVRITVIRADGSGEKVTIYTDGTASDIVKIEIPVVDVDTGTGIRLKSTTAELPLDTVLKADEIVSGPVFEIVSTSLADVKDFVVFELKLESDGYEITPDGKVRISIPIPENFDSSKLAVYRIDSDGARTPYSVSVTIVDGAEYATFETDHFSIYALAEISDEMIEKDETPKTGTSQIINYIIVITMISAIGILACRKLQS